MLSKIKDYLFGHEESFKDAIIGQLTARIKNRNPSINYTWTGEHLLSGQQKPTAFILEGNSSGPYKEQLTSAHAIVNSLKEIELEINSTFLNQTDIKDRFKGNWLPDFFLSAVVPYEDSFEINYEPINEDELDYVSCIWKNGRLTDIEGK